MHLRKGVLLAVATILVLSVFFPWVVIESKNIVISGMKADGTAYGKPGVLTLFFATLIILFSFASRVWAHRICLFCAAIHVGWAVRNFIILSTCQGGECPQRQTAFYVYLISSILVLVAVLVQDIPFKKTTA